MLPDGFPDHALGTRAIIEAENGRWIVYLIVGLWDLTDPSDPVRTNRVRISTYATRREAEVAASWMARGADRNLKRPPTGI